MLTTTTPNSRSGARICHRTRAMGCTEQATPMQESSVGSRSRAARPPLPDPPGGREGVLVQRLAGHVVAVSKDRPPCSSVRL